MRRRLVASLLLSWGFSVTVALLPAVRRPARGHRCPLPQRTGAPLRRSVGVLQRSPSTRVWMSSRGGPPRLPPRPGGPDLGQYLPLILLILFPSTILSILNGLFFVAVLFPFLGFVAYQLYTRFLVLQAPCPNCGGPAQGPKGGETTCIFCGQNLIAREQIWVVPSKFAGGEGGTPKGYRGAGASEGVIDVEAE